MINVMDDLHGCYQTYLYALSQIQFSEDDTLYVLGDMIDRGPDGIKILQDMSMRWNVIPLLGNHEYMALMVLERLCVEVREDNYDSHLTTNDIKAYQLWMENGGQPTIDAFMKLSNEDKFAIIDYLNDCALFEEVVYQQEHYVLVHAGLVPYDASKALDEYQPHEYIFTSNEENDFPFTMICGHTPTLAYGLKYQNKIYQNGNRIDIDCGLVFGKSLAIYCIDKKEVIYIKNHEGVRQFGVKYLVGENPT